MMRPTLLNEVRFQYSYEERPRVNNGEGMDFVSKVGPQVQISGCCYFGGVSYLPIPENDSRTQLADNVSYIKGGHNVKFGFDYNRSHVDQFFRGNWRGVYIFNNIQSFMNVVNGVAGAAPDQFRIFFGDGKFVPPSPTSPALRRTPGRFIRGLRWPTDCATKPPSCRSQTGRIRSWT